MTKYNYKIYVFDVVYYLSRDNSECILDRLHMLVKIGADHSKYAYAKCATYLYKSNPNIKEIKSIELLHSESIN